MVFAVMMLLAAGCGSDDSSDNGSSESTEQSTSADGDTTTSDPDAPLTASFRGVTPEVIKVGVTTFDWDQLATMGVDLGLSNSDDIYEAALASINERGGINGRMLELYPVVYLPVGNVDAEAACVELTEDHEVFVVVGTTLSDEILCFTDDHETAAVVSAGMTEQRKADARAPYVTIGVETEERSNGFVAGVQEVGALDGATVGVTGSPDVSIEAYESTVQAFRDIGIDPIEGITGDNDEDLVESANDAGIVYERFRAAGVNTTVATTGVPLEMANAVAAGYTTDQWLMLLPMSGTGLRKADVDPSYIDGAYSISETPLGTALQPSMADDPLVAACIDDIEERTGRTFPYELGLEKNDIAAALGACSIVIVLERALTDAGPDLTNESFGAAVEGIGDIDLPGRTGAHLGPDDFSAGGELTTTQFDAETEIWNPVG
jgi:hypothetical protein